MNKPTTVFRAPYNRHCQAVHCVYGGHIAEGDHACYIDGELMHAECAKASKQQSPRCPECGLNHKGEC